MITRSKRLMPLILLLLLGGAAFGYAVTLWVTSMSATVTLAPSIYKTLIFSDDAITPLTNLNFGTLYQTSETSSATSEWKLVVLQMQSVMIFPNHVFIHPALTGSLPTGATIEVKKQAFNLEWITVTVSDAGFFNNEFANGPVVGGKPVQRWQYRIVFGSGSAPVTGTFGIEYTISDT